MSASRVFGFSYVNHPSQKGAGSQDNFTALNHSLASQNPFDTVGFLVYLQVFNTRFLDGQVRYILQGSLHVGFVHLPVNLSPGTLYSLSLLLV